MPEGEIPEVPVIKISASDILARAKDKVDAILSQKSPEELRAQAIEEQIQEEAVINQLQVEDDKVEEARLISVNDALVKLAEDNGLQTFLKAVALSKRLKSQDIILLTHNFGTTEHPNILPTLKIDQDGVIYMRGHTYPTFTDFFKWQGFNVALQDNEAPIGIAESDLYRKLFPAKKPDQSASELLIPKGGKILEPVKGSLLKENSLIKWIYIMGKSQGFDKLTPELIEANYTASLQILEQQMNGPEGPTAPTSTPPSTPLTGPIL